MSGRRS